MAVCLAPRGMMAWRGGFEWSRETLWQDDGLSSLSVAEGKLRTVYGTARRWESWLNVFAYLPSREGHAEGHGRTTGRRGVDR